MNKKKRALALGLAATQLTALSAVVAPLTTVSAFAVENEEAATEDYTISAKVKSDSSRLDVDAKGTISLMNGEDALEKDTEIEITVTVTDSDKYKVKAVKCDDKALEADGDNEGVFKYSVTGEETDNKICPVVELYTVLKASYDLSADAEFEAMLLDTTKPADLSSYDLSEVEGSLTKSALEVIGVNAADVSADAKGITEKDGKCTAAIEITFTTPDNYWIGDAVGAEDNKTITVNVPVEFKKTLTFEVPTLDLGKVDEAPDAAAIAAAIKKAGGLTFKADGTAVSGLAEDTDYTYTASAPTADKKSTITVTLKDTEKTAKLAFDSDDENANKVETTLTYEIVVMIGASVTTTGLDTSAVTGTSFTKTVSLKKSGETDAAALTEAQLGTLKVTEGDQLIIKIEAANGYKFSEEDGETLGAAVTLGSDDISEDNLTVNGDTITVTVPTLAEADKDKSLAVALSGKLVYDPVTVTAFDFNFGTDSDGEEIKDAQIDWDADLATEVAKLTPVLTSITVDGKAITGDALTAIKEKFNLKATVAEGKVSVSIELKGAETTHKLDENIAAIPVKVTKKITLTAADIPGAVTYTVKAADLAGSVTDAIKAEADKAIAALFADADAENGTAAGKFNGLKNVLELTAAVTETNGTYKVKVTPSLKSAAGTDYVLDLTGDTNGAYEYAVTLTKLAVTAGFENTVSEAVTLPTNKSETAEGAVEAAVLAALGDLTFTTAGGDTVTLTEDTDYTVTVTLNEASKQATVKVEAVGSSIASVTTKTETVTYKYTPKTVTVVSSATESAKAEVPGNATAASLKAIVLETLGYTNASEADFTITLDKTDAASAFAGSDTTATVVVTLAIKNTDDHTFKDEEGNAATSATVDVFISKGDEVPEFNTEFGGAYAADTDADTLYVSGELTADSIKAALKAAAAEKFSVEFTATGSNIELTAADYDLVVTYTSGNTASVSVELTASGAKKAILKTVTPQSISVARKYTTPAATATITEAFANGSAAAAVKTAVENKVKELLADIAASDLNSVTASVADADVAAGEHTVNVTVTLKNNAVFTDETDTTTVKVTYTVSEPEPTGNTITVNAPNATVTGIPSKAEDGDEITFKVTAAAGYKVNSVSWKTAAGAATTLTADAEGNYKFTMPDEAVTVTVATSSTTVNPSRPSGGSGSSRPSGSSTSIDSSISSATGSSTVTLPSGKTTLNSSELYSASSKKLTLIVPVSSTYSWTLKPSGLPSTSSSLIMGISNGPTVSQSELGKVKGEPVTDVMTFKTYANNLGKAATLTVTTPAKSTAAQTKFANLYKVNDNGALEFVVSAKIGTDGKAVLPMSESGDFALLVSNESKLPGDINNDCTLNITDAVSTIDRIMADFKGDVFKLDLNGDGALDVRDVVMMVDRIMGIK